MGLLNKLKALKNTVTGGAASVYIESEAVSFGEPFALKVIAQVKDADVKINRVYVEIQGIEEVEVPDTDVIYEYEDDDYEVRRELVSAQVETLTLELTLDHAQVLKANELYEWQANIELPEHAQGFYEGHYTQHYYIARASLDCFGNDPDSDWQPLKEA
ncbi:hypothetical protein CBF23_009820 [Marinomonas agarivorans]|nr:hypothetical protein CBF23_009820 [Marinomonas agarivorans]